MFEKFDFTDSIKFTDVNFSFKTNENDLSGNSIERQVLKNLNFEINTGEKVLLVGKTGSGKSTVLKLLLKYFKNYSGSITIDGKNLCDIKAESLYSKFGMIHQNVFLFDDTIENNIRLGLNFQDTEIDKAIKHSGLLPLIEKNPDGKKFKVGENGSKLSGGEKQRLAIARCLLLNLPVLILDEITSSLDAETAQEIEKQILSLQDKTVIAVSHRLNKNLLAQYNKIIVLQDGRVCECGTFDELIRLKKIFYSLYTLEAVERIQ
ncbi:ATP-binding cassette domain-containing protein [Treponema pedis]|uniref:ATP-binding cassette domain-containing protein n=1 Tax=Treponema pedis TaxID=409322 RepID=UPI00041E7AD4|nr:ATP-binding cassette domain-containing protein [Treponema pedis]